MVGLGVKGPSKEAALLGSEWAGRFLVGSNVGKQGTPAEAFWRSVDGIDFVERSSESPKPSVRGSPDLETAAMSEPEAGMGMVTGAD